MINYNHLSISRLEILAIELTFSHHSPIVSVIWPAAKFLCRLFAKYSMVTRWFYSSPFARFLASPLQTIIRMQIIKQNNVQFQRRRWWLSWSSHSVPFYVCCCCCSGSINSNWLDESIISSNSPVQWSSANKVLHRERSFKIHLCTMSHGN